MGTPFKPIPTESVIDPGSEFSEVVTEVDRYHPQDDHLNITPDHNTQVEVNAGKGENRGYRTFSLSRFLDGIRVTGKEFGTQTPEMQAEEEKLQQETGVTLQRNVVENPFGENGKPIEGSVTMPSISDLHMSTQPLESNRTYTISQKDANSKWYQFKHIGYKLIRWVEKNIYTKSEGQDGGKIREVGFQRFMEILPTILECEEEKLPDLFSKMVVENDGDKVFNYAWNRAVTFRKKWKDESHREDLIHQLKYAEKYIAGQRAPISDFREQKLWEIRNQLIEIFVPKLLKEHLGDTKDTTIIAIDGGDSAHDGGVLEDHRSVRSMLMNTFKDVTAGKKFLSSTGGNHEMDAREPKALLEILKYYGDRIFYQQVSPKKGIEDGKENLIVGLNTFIMAPEWEEVLDAYIAKNEDGLSPDQINELNERKKEMLEKQSIVFKEMSEFNGNCIVIHAHNSRRFLEYIEREGIAFKPNVQIKIISGHTHENDNYRALVNKPVTIKTYIKEFMEIYKSSGFIIIDGKKIRLPKGLMTVIDERGNVRVKSLEYTKDERQEVSKQLQTEIY